MICDFLGNSCEKNEPCSGGEQYRSYIGGATNGDGGVHPGDKKGEGGREGGRYVKSGSCELRDEGDELK